MRCIDKPFWLAYMTCVHRKLLFLAALAAFGVAGCSSVPTHVNKGPVRATTYSVMASKAPANVIENERRQEVHQLIQAAIERELGRKGLRAVEREGQVQVGYMVVVANNATTATYDEYFGYGRDASTLSDRAHKAVSRSNSRDLIEIGAIVIDVVDPRDSKVLYRNIAYMDVREVTPANREARIGMLVASCLADLRPGN